MRCWVVLLSIVVPLLAGCGESKPQTVERTLVLVLPPSAKPPAHAPDRVSKLTVDGEDHTEPRDVRRTVTLTSPKGKATAEVVYSFWPNTYTNIVRKKMVKLGKEPEIEVDFNKEDPETPDLIKPIYFPTPVAVVREMCKMAKIGKDDVVTDIGCGDGRLPILAVKEFGAKRGIGLDIEEYLVEQAKKNAEKDGVTDRTEFRVADATKITDLSDSSVVLLYLGDFLNQKLRPVLQKTLKPGARVVSHRFLLGDWKPDESRKIKAINNFDKEEAYELHLWVIK
ncbi:MAG: class I SAM-dependent methyltransferase [Gemmataceae bacterium]